jgi:hypothetical protein
VGAVSSNVRSKSASTASLREQDLARIRRLSVRQRMLLALELGRRGRAVQERAKRGREAVSGRA